MKFLMTAMLIVLGNFCWADPYYHEFEGISEAYNIRNLKVLSKFLPQDPVIIEAGAYQGRDTIKLSQKFPSGEIYAFEPLLTAFPKLAEALQNQSNVFLFNMALDKVSGIKKLYICHGAYAQSPVFEFHSSLLKPTPGSEINLLGPIEMVPCISLKDFCQLNQIISVDMLWLSTEGNELQILEGAQEFLEPVSLVYARTHLYPTRESITQFYQLRNFLENRGFILLSHFFLKNIHGDALFVKKEMYQRIVGGL